MSDGSGLLPPTCHEIPQFCYNSVFLGFLARPLVMTRPVRGSELGLLVDPWKMLSS